MLLRSLDGELGRAGVDVELCVAGGAILPLVFHHEPGTRRPSALFGRLGTLRDAAARVSQFAGAPTGWLNDTVRRVMESTVGGNVIVDLERLRVFEARPDYVFAMKCAALAHEEGDGTTETINDIRYLLRLLDMKDADAAMSALAPYFTASQLPDDLRMLLTELVGH